MSEPSDLLFQTLTPLEFSVRTTRAYWNVLIDKHPEVTNRLMEIQRCLTTPHEIRRSKQDPAVYLFYDRIAPYYLCVVAKRLNGDGFIVTCYVTDAVKEGTRIWPTSA